MSRNVPVEILKLMICRYKCSCRTLENCTGGSVLAVMRSTLEISTSYLKKAAEVLPVRCPLQSLSPPPTKGLICKEHERKAIKQTFR